MEKSLTNLNLHESRLEEDLLSHIEALPSLHSFCLDNASGRKELCFNRGIVKLRHLRFWDLALLNNITIEKGAMPNLEFLGIRSCLTLETLPQETTTGLKILPMSFGVGPLELVRLVLTPRDLLPKAVSSAAVDLPLPSFSPNCNKDALKYLILSKE
ncbi:NB-ARC domain-containing disease resistance protein [Prunus dulcis]|uniref:NB-ARC domain-containing disease resistance protein n=1 Tax=Prunus dulcis TaxID=3755 RepID=A0A4Y1RVP7_PRUDU|nr:NB-ARC domain-containing disease resistance protein [Prunus dulcis]